MLLKMACVKKLMLQLEGELKEKNFSSAKEIDDYQKLKQKNFLDLIMDIHMDREKYDTVTLSRILEKNCNVGYVLMKELDKMDLKLANRYFESFVYSNVNKATVTSAEIENDAIALPKMSDEEVISCIQGTGQYVIDRFLNEQQNFLNGTGRNLTGSLPFFCAVPLSRRGKAGTRGRRPTACCSSNLLPQFYPPQPDRPGACG